MIRPGNLQERGMRMGKIFANILYGIGTLTTAVLGVIALLRVDVVLHPEAMLPMQLWESAYFGLCIGFFLMLPVCMWAYEANDIRLKPHAGRNAFLLFLPGIVCFGCFISLVGMLVRGVVYSSISSLY